MQKTQIWETATKTCYHQPLGGICVDLIRLYTLKNKDKTKIDFMCVTMIDPATSWFKFVELPVLQQRLDIPMVTQGQQGRDKHIHQKQPYFNKTSATVGNTINRTWFSHIHITNTLSTTTKVSLNFTLRPSVIHMI